MLFVFPYDPIKTFLHPEDPKRTLVYARARRLRSGVQLCVRSFRPIPNEDVALNCDRENAVEHVESTVM